MGSSVPVGPLPHRILKEETSNDSDPTDAVIFVGISLLLGIACRHLLKGTRVPYTVALLVLGIVMGAIEYGTHHGLGRIGDGIRIWENIDPDLLLVVFLPALLFESSFLMEVHQIKRCLVQMILLAGPGVLISTLCLGAAIKLTFPFDWSWITSLLLGGLLSATDPVAVVALLKDLGASKKLSTIIEGESLMNDGTAIVVFQLFFRMISGWNFNMGSIITFLAKVSLGAVLLGIAFGIASNIWLGFVFNDTVIEITLTLTTSYIAFFTAQEGINISGVLAVMSLGMYFSAVAKTAFKGESQQSLYHFWEMVAYIANTLIFILSGVVIANGILSDEDDLKSKGNMWGYLLLLYIYVLVSRMIVVGTLFPFLRYFGYGLDLKEASILVWSGLRGAVALALSLSVKRSSDSSMHISRQTGTLFVFLTGGIVFFTLIVNGSTTQFILHYLNMDKLSPPKRRILNYTKYEMLNKALEAFGDLGDDEELGPVDWPTVKRYIACLDDVEGECMHPHAANEGDDRVDHMNIEDIRIRFLNGVQAAYWEMLEEGRITQAIANILMQSVDEALDLVSEPLCDWNGLSPNVSIPAYYRILQTDIFPQKLVTHFTVTRLESACYICAAFLRAHRIARQQLHEFIGDSDVTSAIHSESEAEGEAARKFLEDVRITFPQVLRVVKTRQATYSVLSHLINYIHNLEKSGLLEQKEMIHLHDAVQMDLKTLLRNPPLVKIPKLRDLIRTNPLLGALPSTVSQQLVGSTKEIMKLRGTTIYKEGSKPNGIWLISNGVIKWTSKALENRHMLHPTFTHGSTLGLYEVLVGKPYICDMITDSVVLCFFFEAESILAALQSDPVVEDFFWRESVIILAKLMLPQIFGKMSMHDLRALVAEKSTITIYIRGETLEMPQNCIGFLLEGFIKTQGFQELVTSPAALVHPNGNQDVHESEASGARTASFSHQVSCYHVETRARVILINISAFGSSRFCRKSSSLISVDDSARPVSREHSGLMGWPEHFFKPKQHCHDSGQQANNLSARAMQLSVYGTMADESRLHAQNSSKHDKVKPSHSRSYPRVFSDHGETLVSVRSEGSSTMQHRRQMQGQLGQKLTQQPKSSSRKEGLERRESSDESGGEDEHVVRIDSLSRLSFVPASGQLHHGSHH